MEQKVGSAFIEIEAKLDKLEGMLKTKIQSLGEKAGKGFSSSFQQSIQGLAGAITSIVSIGAIKQLGGEILELANNLQQSHIAFTTMLGSAEASEKLLTELSDFASKTPFEIQGIRDNAKQLLAMGVSVENLKPTLKALGDVAAGTGADFTRLALNYGQVVTQGHLTGRELRDFAVNGVPLLAELSKMLGETEVEVQKMISNGEISAEIVAKVFEKMTSEGGKFANMMDAQSKSLGGLVSTLKDEVALTGEAIGNQFLPMASSIVSAISGVVEKIREWVQEHPTATKAIVSFVAVGGGLLALLGAMIPLLGTVAVAFGAISRPVLAVVGAVAALTAGGLAYYDYAEEQRIQNKYLGESYSDLKKRQEELKESQEKLNKSYEDGIISQEEYEQKQDELKKESEDLKKAQDQVQISLGEVREEMEKIKNSNLDVSDKIAKLEELRKKAMQTESALNEALKRLKELGVKVKQEQKEEQEGLRTEFGAGGVVSQTPMLYNLEYTKTQNLQKELGEFKDVIGDLTNEIDGLNKATEKNTILGGGDGSGGSGSSKAQKEALKEVKEAYKDIEKAIHDHNDAIEDAQKKVESLNKKYDELKNKAKDAFHEAKNAVKELDGQMESLGTDHHNKMIDIYQKNQDKLKEMERKNKRIGEIAKYKSLHEWREYSDEKWDVDTKTKDIIEYLELQEEQAKISEIIGETTLKEAEALNRLTEAEKEHQKYLEKRGELEYKKAAALEKQSIAEAFSKQGEILNPEDIKVFSTEVEGQLKARYQDETGKMVEIVDFKNIQYAQDLFNKSEAIRLEKEALEKKIADEKLANEELTMEKIKLDQMYTTVHAQEINKQKSKVDELIRKYHELAKAQASAGARGARAFGGEVKAGLPYLVGENFKPELFVPSTSGSVVPVNNYNQSRSYHFSGITINTNRAEDFRSEIQNHIGDYT